MNLEELVNSLVKLMSKHGPDHDVHMDFMYNDKLGFIAEVGGVKFSAEDGISIVCEEK